MCQIEVNTVFMFGGAFVGGNLAQETLYFALIKDKEREVEWKEPLVKGPKPGKRYGHSLNYSKPYLILFGGSTGSVSLNETWILDLSAGSLQWTKLEIADPWPCERVYHSADVCNSGLASGMLIINGGRNLQGQTCNDVWGLRRHRNGKWDWTMPTD